MWCQIISSSSQKAISPCDDYLPVTIFCPCPEVVIISDILCNMLRTSEEFDNRNILPDNDTLTQGTFAED